MANSQHERSELDPAVRHGRSILSLVDEPRLGTAPPGAVWFTVCGRCVRTKVRDRWIHASDALELIGGNELQLTLGICPSCSDHAAAKAERRSHEES